MTQTTTSLLSSTPQIPGYCGPASLQAILAHYGVKANEDKLIELSGASRNEAIGDKGLIQAARALGFEGFSKDDATIEDLAKYAARGIPSIVHMLTTDERPYFVVMKADDQSIWLQDSEIGNTRVMPLDTFQKSAVRSRLLVIIPSNVLQNLSKKLGMSIAQRVVTRFQWRASDNPTPGELATRLGAKLHGHAEVEPHPVGVKITTPSMVLQIRESREYGTPNWPPHGPAPDRITVQQVEGDKVFRAKSGSTKQVMTYIFKWFGV